MWDTLHIWHAMRKNKGEIRLDEEINIKVPKYNIKCIDEIN